MKCFFLKEYIYLTIKSILLRENGDLMMCRRKFTHILTTLEAQFSILQTNLEKDLEEKYLASMRRHSGGGGAMVMIKKETIDGYRDSIDRIMSYCQFWCMSKISSSGLPVRLFNNLHSVFKLNVINNKC